MLQLCAWRRGHYRRCHAKLIGRAKQVSVLRRDRTAGASRARCHGTVGRPQVVLQGVLRRGGDKDEDEAADSKSTGKGSPL
jgi:hypothetical protein